MNSRRTSVVKRPVSFLLKYSLTEGFGILSMFTYVSMDATTGNYESSSKYVLRTSVYDGAETVSTDSASLYRTGSHRLLSRLTFVESGE